MNKELEFTKKLEEVKNLAREQGNMITQEQVMEAFQELELSGDQMQMVYDYLLQSKIGIGQHLLPEDYLTEKEQDYLEEPRPPFPTPAPPSPTPPTVCKTTS